MIRLAILGSTRGTTLNPIVDAIASKKLDASIELVISNKASAPVLDKAAGFGIQALYVNPQGLSREEFDRQLSGVLQQHRVELVVLIGYMRILSPSFIADWNHKIINIHPSLLPAFAGLMDLDVHRAVITERQTISGCTVHYVTEDVDAGPVIMQAKCAVLAGDTPETLKARVQEMEGPLLIHAIQMIAATCY